MVDKLIVADAGLLPEAGTVGLDKFNVALWVAHDDAEAELAGAEGNAPVIRVENRSQDVGAALARLGVDKARVFFLVRRVNFVSRFIAGAGTTCGEWTPVVDGKNRKGFWKVSAVSGWCPARCDFCYLLPFMSAFGYQGIALNVGEFASQVGRKRRAGKRMVKPPVVNLGETGGLLEWAHHFNAPEIVQAYLDAARQAGVIPYILTKRALPGLRLDGAHVGISLNTASVMQERSPGASTPAELLRFLDDARQQGASTVIRWGPVIAGREDEYEDLANQVHALGLGAGRFTVDLLRFSEGHEATPPGFEYRAHKRQEPAGVQLGHLRQVREFFPNATITGCKLDPVIAADWVRQGVIQAMPCACWV